MACSPADPLLGGTFGLALIALSGMPPFGLFASEIAIARAGFGVGMGWVIAIAFVILLVVVAAVVTHARHMLLGSRRRQRPRRSTSAATAVPLIGGLSCSRRIGVSIWPIEHLLERCRVGGRPMTHDT